jgi:flagellar protein FliO/FliZ
VDIWTVLRVIISLAAVLGLIWFVQKRAGRGSMLRSKAKPLNVVGRQNIGTKASVAVVEFGGKRFLLGVTEHAINVLDSTEIPAEELVTETVEAAAAPVAALEASTPAAAPKRQPAKRPAAAKVAPAASTAKAASTASTADDFATALTEAEATRPAEVAAQQVAQPVTTPVAQRSPQLAAQNLASGLAAPQLSPVAGSILSAATWKQAFAALRTGR